MSFFRRLFKIFGWKSSFVGRDLYGNKFYEYPSTTDDPRRTHRLVKYIDKGKITEYATGGLRLPIQWSAWLTHTRRDPPSMDELMKDYERRKTLQHNTRVLALRDEESRKPRIAVSERAQPASPLSIAQGSLLAHADSENPSKMKSKRDPLHKRSAQELRIPTNPGADYTPLSWSPTSARQSET